MSTFAPPRLVEARNHTPSGAPSWPRVLLSGPPGSWKSGTAALLSADPRITGMHWLEIGDGENTADEYGAIPGVKYSIIDHDGSFLDIYNQVAAHYYLALEAEERGEVIALVMDSASGLNDMLTEMGDTKAREKKIDQSSKRDARATFWSVEYDATITPELRALIKKRDKQLWRIVHNWPGPVVLLSAERMAAVFENGQPNGKQDWWLECRKDLPSKVTAHVRLAGSDPATVVKLRSAKQMIRSDAQTPFTVDRFAVADLVFDWVGCEAGVSRAPMDREYDATAPMPDEVQVDRVGNIQPRPGQSEHELKRRIAEQRRLIANLLEAQDVDAAAIAATEIDEHQLASDDILSKLSEPLRERLGVRPGIEAYTLRELGRAVVDYVGKHKVSPRNAPDAEPAQMAQPA